MAKITLSPDDITRLLKGHPDAELELISKATEQVADGMNRKVTRELVEKRVGELMESLLTEQVGWTERRLAPRLQAMVDGYVRDASEQFFQETKGRKLMELVRAEIVRQNETTARDLVRSMIPSLRQMIREEIRAMLAVREG